MIKLIFCLRRRQDISEEEFHRYWRHEHGPLVIRHAATLGIRRYVQLHTVSGPVNAMLAATRGGPEAYDGVAELWFDSADALARRRRRRRGWRRPPIWPATKSASSITPVLLFLWPMNKAIIG